MKLNFMVHNLKQILIIDDKLEGNNRGEVFIENLSDDLKKLVDFRKDIKPLFKILNEWSVEVLFDHNKYEVVFLHHSYKDSLLSEPQLSDLRDKLRILDLIIFSGGAQTNISTRQISRDVLFTCLKPAIDAYSKIGVFPTLYLFYRKINRYYPIIDEMYKVLENEGKETLLKHKSFELYTSICGWDFDKVQKHYKENLTEEQIADKIINEWRLNFNQ